MKKIFTILFLFFFAHAHPQYTITYKPGVLYKDGKHWKLNDKKLNKREIRTEINTVPASATFNKKPEPWKLLVA